MVRFLLLLSACAGPSVDSAAPAPPDAVPGWPDAISACGGLASPFPMRTASDVAAAWRTRPSVATVSAGLTRASDAASATGCPAHTTDMCGAGDRYTGGCASGEVAASGTAVGTGCDDGGTWTFTAFEVSGAGWRFGADGTLDAQVSGDERLAFDLTLDLAGLCADGGCDGRYTWAGTAFRSGMEDTRAQRVSAVPATGPAGEWCLDQQVTPVDGCAAEGVGWTTLQGSGVAVVIWDGDAACDGCGALYVDGAPVGALCDDGAVVRAGSTG